jgi:hypothetical protein
MRPLHLRPVVADLSWEKALGTQCRTMGLDIHKRNSVPNPLGFFVAVCHLVEECSEVVSKVPSLLRFV